MDKRMLAARRYMGKRRARDKCKWVAKKAAASMMVRRDTKGLLRDVPVLPLVPTLMISLPPRGFAPAAQHPRQKLPVTIDPVSKAQAAMRTLAQDLREVGLREVEVARGAEGGLAVTCRVVPEIEDEYAPKRAIGAALMRVARDAGSWVDDISYRSINAQ